MPDFLDELNVIAAQGEIDEQTLQSNICWFCNKPTAEKEWAEEVYLHRNFTMELHLSGRRNKWEELRRKLPCCQTCCLTHRKTKNLGTTLAWLGGAGGLILGLTVPIILAAELKIVTPIDMRLSMLGGIILGAIIGYFSGRQIGVASSRDTKPLKYAVHHPVIASLIEQGWKFGKPR